MLFLLFIGELMVWSRVMMSPLQNYYLMDYLDSTAWQGAPYATTKVVWIKKTAPKREGELVSEADVVSAAADKRSKIPVKISSSAIADGWSGVAKSLPQQVNSAELEPYLETYVYDGNSLWRVFRLPILGDAAVVLFLLAIRNWWKGRSRREAWDEWRTKESSFSWEKGWAKVRIALTKREEPPISIVPRTVWQAPKKPVPLLAATPLPPKKRVVPAPAAKPKEPYVLDKSKWIGID